ncbi:MAG: peptide-methionine (S)-S-oxide reductase MsrA [Rhodospirillales bacterium]|nr:peptide-methionine (S)-S-oxide reductase MsrA [Rhodospirillales bacterium]
MSAEKAILAGGCFWGMQDLIRKRPGIISTRVGYTGGTTTNPGYNEICIGDTGHAEAIEIEFDPAKISYRSILEFFFQIHDPTTADRQGNDRGTQYRSAIFFLTPEQEKTARETIAEINAAGFLSAKIVTEVTPAGPFYPAEKDHQDYLLKHPDGYTCHFIRPNWKLPPKAAE